MLAMLACLQGHALTSEAFPSFNYACRFNHCNTESPISTNGEFLVWEGKRCSFPDQDSLQSPYIKVQQLHGYGSRVAFPSLIQDNRVIYVLRANGNGSLLNTISDEECSMVDWILVDRATGGSGKTFDWAQFKLPVIRSKCGWLLAGGIKPENVSEALSTLKPQGVDISSGICASYGIQKGQSRITSFMKAVHSVRY